MEFQQEIHHQIDDYINERIIASGFDLNLDVSRLDSDLAFEFRFAVDYKHGLNWIDTPWLTIQ